MTTNLNNPTSSAPFPGSAEETLRVVAGLPAPAGLEDRVRAALHLASIDFAGLEDSQRPENGSGESGAGIDRRGRVLAWPAALKPQTSWMRTAAAAAIVFVVAGGGWGVYTRVEQNRPARILVMPPRIGASGGFSGAGAVRTPQTLTRPTVSTAGQPTVSTAGQPTVSTAETATAETATAEPANAQTATVKKAAAKAGTAVPQQ
jgi:hypothetical protein